MSTLNRMKWPEAEAELRARLKAAPHGTKGDIAMVLEITPTHLSQIISGKRPMTREVAEKVAAHFKIEIDYRLTPAPAQEQA